MPIFTDRSLGKSLEFFDINIEMVEKYIKKLNASKKEQVGKDQEKAQSEKDSHSKNRGGKKPN